MKKISASACRAWTNINRFAIAKGDSERLATVRVIHLLINRITARIHQADPNREIRLHISHTRLDLVLIDGLPNVCRPMLVELMRIFDEEHVIRIEFEIAAAAVRRDRRGIRLPAIREYCHDFCPSSIAECDAANHVVNLELLQRQQLPRLMREI